MTDDASLSDLRQEMELLTLEIVKLAGRRSELAAKIGAEKIKKGIELVDREVERNLKAKVVEQCRRDASDIDFALQLVNELITESIRKQESHFETQVPQTAYHIFVKARKLESAGKEVFHLEVGEPDFGPPVTVCESMSNAVAGGHAGYTQSAGIQELRTKIAEHMNRFLGADISADQVIATVGGRFALYLSLATSLRPGDEAIIINPSYPAYSDCIRQVGGRPVHVSTQLENEWELDIGSLEDNINQTTRMIILNSPCNPTGKILDKSTIEKIVEISIENEILIVSDEVYSEFSFTPHTSTLQFPECNQIYVNSFSKSFGMTGFRLGYAISNVETVQKMIKLQNLSLTCVPEFIQYAGVKALDLLDEVKEYATIIENRQTVLCDKLEKLPLSFRRPDGGFYIFPKLNLDNLDGLEFAQRLLIEKGVAVVPGTAYGQEYSRFFRISVCQPEDILVEAAKRMEEILG
ncbi:MAG: aminotransferase class I/II-fold pyridoxal phosphate-dependent enzyme [Candidatus Thorarchaeota archaeon]